MDAGASAGFRAFPAPLKGPVRAERGEKAKKNARPDSSKGMTREKAGESLGAPPSRLASRVFSLRMLFNAGTARKARRASRFDY